MLLFEIFRTYHFFASTEKWRKFGISKIITLAKVKISRSLIAIGAAGFYFLMEIPISKQCRPWSDATFYGFQVRMD